MTMRVLGCWALCAALLTGQDKPAAEETKKPANATEAVAAMTKARSSRPRSRAEVPGILTKMIAAADIVLGFKDASDEQKEQALVTKASALSALTNYKPEAVKDLHAFAAMVKKEHPKSAAVKSLDYAMFSAKYLKDAEKFDPAALVAFHELKKKYPNDRSLPMYYGALANVVESSEGAKEATKFVEEGLKLFPNDKQLTNSLKGLKLIGQPLEIVGPTLEGSEYNLANQKGKVVLVDFWATWCGPCIGELPHVKAAYKKYHNKGFEIVGVSLDREREKLENFIKKEEMTWPQIIFSKPEEMYWKNPVAVKHEIRGIPATFLIGRDGKIAARNLRGDKLAKAVAKEIAKSSPTAN